MTERVPSDHESVTTHRINYGRVGHTHRPELVVSPHCSVDEGSVVQLSLEGTKTWARVEETLSGKLAIRGAFENARLARSQGEGDDRLQDWAETHDLSPGDRLLLDELRSGHVYGLRRPGQRLIYAVPRPPNDSLGEIARNVEE